jgi:hypothetical protein
MKNSRYINARVLYQFEVFSYVDFEVLFGIGLLIGIFGMQENHYVVTDSILAK